MGVTTISGMTIPAVIDTNVFIDACLGTGAASSVVRACLQGEVQPLMGVALMAQYEDVLARDELMAACRLSRDKREELLDIFIALYE